MSDLQVALHLSSSAVHTVVGYATGTPENPKIKISAVGLANTDAFAAGKIERREYLISAIHKSLQEASDMAGVQIHEVCLSLSTPLMISMNDTQTVVMNTSSTQTTVRQSDMHRAKELVRDKLRAEGCEIFQLCQIVTYLDGTHEVKDPVNMYANKIDVVNHVMALPASYHHQVSSVIDASGIAIGDTLFDGLVSAEYALTKDEKKQGVCFIDIGQETTKVCVYYDGAVIFSECLDVGGQTVTYDISVELGLTTQESESLKCQQGTLILDPSKRASFINVKRRTGGEATVSLRHLNNIITARYENIFTHINKALETRSMSNMLGMGVVLAGGGCQIDGMAHFLGRYWGVPVRMMTTNSNISICPKTLSDEKIQLINEYLKNNKLHSVLGSLLYQNSEQFMKDSYTEMKVDDGLANKVSDGWQAVVNWLKDKL
ncbi:cell division protein FtsA [Moraxella sp. ZY200743]|uniref:cell division protein FtsA n=1 Tax=Moraxella sp. ZY200743 TaxID=2911970 RepID=UPI003D7ECD70